MKFSIVYCLDSGLAVVVGCIEMGDWGTGGTGTYGSYSHQKRSTARACADLLVELDDALHTGDFFPGNCISMVLRRK